MIIHIAIKGNLLAWLFNFYSVSVLNDFGNIRDENAVQYLIYHKIHVDVFILQSIIPPPLFYYLDAISLGTWFHFAQKCKLPIWTKNTLLNKTVCDWTSKSYNVCPHSSMKKYIDFCTFKPDFFLFRNSLQPFSIHMLLNTHHWYFIKYNMILILYLPMI